MEETMLIQVALAVLLLLVVALYRRMNKSRGMLEAMGIPVDPTSFLTAHKTDFKVWQVLF